MSRRTDGDFRINARPTDDLPRSIDPEPGDPGPLEYVGAWFDAAADDS